MKAVVASAQRVGIGEREAQLASDLGYLGNIVSALSVESKELSRWIDVVSMDDETGKVMVLDVDGADVIFNTVAKMRGWALTQA